MICHCCNECACPPDHRDLLLTVSGCDTSEGCDDFNGSIVLVWIHDGCTGPTGSPADCWKAEGLNPPCTGELLFICNGQYGLTITTATSNGIAFSDVTEELISCDPFLWVMQGTNVVVCDCGADPDCTCCPGDRLTFTITDAST